MWLRASLLMSPHLPPLHLQNFLCSKSFAPVDWLRYLRWLLSAFFLSMPSVAQRQIYAARR